VSPAADGLPRTLTSNMSASFRAWKLDVKGPDMVVFRTTVKVRALFGIFVVVGLAVPFMPLLFASRTAGNAGAAPEQWFDTLARIADSVGFVLAAVVGGIFVIFGLLGLAGRFEFGLGPVIFDRRRGLTWKEGRPPRPGSLTGWLLRRAGLTVDRTLIDGLRLRDVWAVQVCCGMANVTEPGKPDYSETRPYMTWEINLVLSSPSGQRVHIISHAKEKALREEARQLADFLRVPLLDHTSSPGH